MGIEEEEEGGEGEIRHPHSGEQGPQVMPKHQ